MKPAAILAVLALAAGARDEYSVEPLKEAAPAPVSEAVRKELSASALRVVKGGKPLFDFWLRSATPVLPAREQIAVNYTPLTPGQLVGLVRVHAGASDFRGQKYAPGVYTLRYALQPEDGDHQGTSDSRDFLVMAPGDGDAAPGNLPPDDVVKLSTKVSGKKHPAVLWLAKPSSEGQAPRVIRDDQHDRWLLDAELGTKEGKLRLVVVIVGKAAE